MSMTEFTVKTSDVAVVSCPKYTPESARAALSEALSAVDGLSCIKPGMKVVIKANLVSGKNPDTATTTHPVLISELVKMLLEKGACVTVGDSPGGLYNAARLAAIYSATGMKMCEEAGAQLNRNFAQSDGKTKNGLVLHDFKYTSYLDDADLIIDFAKLKTHGMMVMSCAVKNMFGVIPGVTKPEYHSRFPEIERFSDMLIDLYENFAPCLSIIDAVYGMEGNGPTAGTPRYVGAVIASKNGHYADMAAAEIMGIDRRKLPLFCRANERGLCPNSLDELTVYGDLEKFRVKDYDLICDASSDFSLVVPKPLAWLSDKLLRPRPKLTAKKCVGCKICYDTCPKHAIEMVNGKPHFDYDKCIRCFCCQEFCPKGALHVHRSVAAKIINGK